MKARLVNWWQTIRASYWFVPTLMALGSVVLVVATEQVDQAVRMETLPVVGWIYGGGPEGARTVLATVASSMITVAGVVFSITMVALVLASSQFGPRLLESFMRDTGNQTVLGVFIATFLYCILALRVVRGPAEPVFVPHLTVTLGVGLGVASVGVLIYFIHHVTTSIQAPNVVARVGGDLDDVVDRLFPPEEEGETRPLPEKARAGEAHEIASRASGYVRAVDLGRLVSVAAERGGWMEVPVRPGDYVVEGDPLALLWDAEPPEGKSDEESGDALEREVNGAFVLGNQRIAAQDPRFAVHQLVEVAVRALSPGTNDPYTAMNCVDRLAVALARVARRPRPDRWLRDDEGDVRVRVDPVAFPDLACAAFDHVREYGREHPLVLTRILDALESVARHVRREEDLEQLRWHAEKVLRSGQEGVPEAPDREELVERHRSVSAALDERARELGVE